jgi:hypothetical protein
MWMDKEGFMKWIEEELPENSIIEIHKELSWPVENGCYPTQNIENRYKTIKSYTIEENLNLRIKYPLR